MDIKLHSQQIVVNFENTIKKARQRATLAALAKDGNLSEMIKYLETFAGHHKYVNIERFTSTGTDKLADKSQGEVKRLFDQMLNTDASHKPIKRDADYFGVEIECCVPYAAVGMEGRHTCDYCNGSGEVSVYSEDEDGNQIDSDETENCDECSGRGYFGSEENGESAREALAEMFRSEKIKFASLKDDGSIREPEGYFSVEVTVLTQFSNTENLRRACSLLNRIKAKVNKSCGLHVHLDSRHLNEDQVKSVGRQFTKAMPVLASLVPKSRRENSYCKLEVSNLNGGRYFAVNLTAFRKFRTIEVRLHSSTTDFSKIMSWAKLVQAISTSTIKKVCRELNDLTDYVNIDQDLLEYFGQRHALFNGGSNVNTSAQDQDEAA